MPVALFTCLLTLLFTLTGCGQKGALTRPEAPQAASLSSTAGMATALSAPQRSTP
ncbi:hypothetical protein SAMN05421831_11084 [Allopseudospirillum japonicum]|uniref:Lipoprotein-attachment site-containing protein n=1 Tax=Allopseudospirillum japonicum TaxID=64971 RepID=A0A1H6TSP2_9GAMM|nr:lipoprotein [Allopseudospirillum japonicum]SEI79250.1 hypothetical protein SAMN05421831_11084 [Allopseudospirillum japonicum]